MIGAPRHRIIGSSALALLAAGWISAQAPAPTSTAAFRVYLLDREIGQEASTVRIEGSTRRLESTLTFHERGGTHALAATLDTALDGAPRRLIVRGRRPREGRVDIDVTISGGRAQIRDDTASATLEFGRSPFFPVEGGAPVALHEFLIRHWRSTGRLRELSAAPAGPVRIERRAESQIELLGRTLALERLGVDGPVWGRETAWVEPGGALVALATWAGGLPLLAVRDGYETRLDRFREEARNDRLNDVNRLTQTLVPEFPEGVVLTGATVIVSGKRPPIPDATVVIRGGRIASVGPSSRNKPPADLPALDARGMTVVAGLWDLDGQASHFEWLPLYLGAGVTTIRNASPDAAFTAALREAAADGYLLGPQMLTVGSIDGPAPDAVGAVAETPDDGPRVVRRYRGDGVRDLEIGSYVTAGTLRAMGAETNRLGMSMTGPVPAGLTVDQALDAGLTRVRLLPREATSLPAMREAFAALAKRQRTFVPLAAWLELLQRPGSRPVPNVQPAIARVPRGLVRRFIGLDPVGTQDAPADVTAMLREARTAGVGLAAGSGAGLPGFALHRELELYVEAGMSAADALHTATASAAQLMGMGDRGTVEAGKRADLVVVAGNPLENISNLRHAKWVVVNGKLYDCAKLLKAAGFGE